MNAGSNVDSFAVAEVILILSENDLRCSGLLTTASSTSWFDDDLQLLLVATVWVAHKDLINTRRVQCSSSESQSISLDEEGRWNWSKSLRRLLVPDNFDGIVRLNRRKGQSAPDETVDSSNLR